MVVVALSDAEARLNELGDRVERGEAVSITRRGLAVARLVAEEAPRQRVDVEGMRQPAETLPWQEGSAGDLYKRVRATDRL